MGVTNTQASESTFNALKRYAKQHFPGKVPTLDQLIPYIIKTFDKRYIQRSFVANNKRGNIRHANKNFACDVCNLNFENKNDLKDHVQTMHKTQLTEMVKEILENKMKDNTILEKIK